MCTVYTCMSVQADSVRVPCCFSRGDAAAENAASAHCLCQAAMQQQTRAGKHCFIKERSGFQFLLISEVISVLYVNFILSSINQTIYCCLILDEYASLHYPHASFMLHTVPNEPLQSEEKALSWPLKQHLHPLLC